MKAVTNDRSQGPGRRAGGTAAAAGGTLSGCILGCLFLGYLIGDYWDANPAAMVVGLFVGVIVGFYNSAKIMWLGRDRDGKGSD